jgi:Putative lumazine-binding/WD40-like Beta Propeller Repeat
MRIPLIVCLLAGVAAGARAQAVFGPGVISTPNSGEAFGTLTPDGKEFYFTIHRDFARHRIVVSRLTSSGWSSPQTLPISGTYNDREPKLSPDGKRLYFSSNRPITAGDTTRRRDLDLWFSDRRTDGTWSAPTHIQGANGPSNDFSPSVTANGTLYFISKRSGGIGKDSLPYNVWRAEPLDLAAGRWKPPVNAGPAINAGFETNVYVTPNDSVMLVSRDGAPDTFGGDDIYLSRRSGGAWQPMRHLPAPINSKEYDYGPLISPDGRFLFVTSHRTGKGDIYRFSIGEIERDDITQAGYDYIDGFYEGDTAKLVRALRPELSKFGFWRDSAGNYAGEHMTHQEAIDYAKKVKARNRPVPPSWPRQVEVLDAQDMTAVAKVTAWWGTDYLLLGRYDGRWMIAGVLWQGP